MLAIARLMLDNFDHVKAFWIMQSMKLSQVALSWGVDDLDGTVVWYDITKRQGEGVHQEMHVGEIQRVIREARKTPVERDTRPSIPTAEHSPSPGTAADGSSAPMTGSRR